MPDLELQLAPGDGLSIVQDGGTVRASVRRDVVAFLDWLIDASRPDRAAGIVAFDAARDYPAGSVGAVLKQLLANGTLPDLGELLDLLAMQITEGQLHPSLGATIGLINGSGPGSVNDRILAETIARQDAVAQEVADRNEALSAEAHDRLAQIGLEQRQRARDIALVAESALRAALAADQERVARGEAVASAQYQLWTEIQAGLSAEAKARLVLAATVAGNYAVLTSEQVARATADAAMAQDIEQLFVDVAGNAADIENESTVRADAVQAEAEQRTTLAAQLRGGYTGTDLAGVTGGMLYQERVARQSQDAALAEQIFSLSAGAGEQFDWKTIWYFDSGVESWSGNGAPTAAGGWLRPANQASGAYVESPPGVAADGTRYGQVRMRLRKTGSPAFAGFLWWRAAGDATWDVARRVALTAPTFDSGGIGLVTVAPAWSVTVDRIRIDLSSAQTVGDFFELDWVAIGRPSPGASSAQLLEEQTTRAAADEAQAAARETLSTVLVGQVDPTGLTLATVAGGLVHAERQARSSQDAAIAESIDTLQATVEGNFTTLDAAVTDEAAARASADGAEALARQSLSATLTGVADPEGLSIGDLTAGLVWQERQARVSATEAIAEDVSGLSVSLGDLASDVLDVQSAVVTLDTAVASQSKVLVAGDRATRNALDSTAETILRDILTLEAERAERTATMASIEQALRTEVVDGLSAEAKARLALAAAVQSNAAAIVSEQTARATATDALAQSIEELGVAVGEDIAAAVSVESSARAALDGSVQALHTVRVEVSGNGSTIVGGVGLAGTSTAAEGPKIAFGVRADEFFVAPPSGTDLPDVPLFVIRTTPTSAGGVSYAPGIYADAAYIINLNASRIDTRALSIRRSDGTILLNAGTDAFTGNAIGLVDGVAAATVRTNAEDGAAAMAALSDPTTGIASRLRNNADQVLGGIISVNAVTAPAGFRAGTLTWNAAGTRTGGYGVAMTPMGIVGYNVSGNPTIAINAATGAVSIAGDLTGSNGLFKGSVSVNEATWATGDGFWAGIDGGLPKLFLGTRDGPRIEFNGLSITQYVTSSTIVYIGFNPRFPAVSVYSYLFHPTAPATADIVVKTDGRITSRDTSGAETLDTNYFSPTTAGIGSTGGGGSGIWVRANKVSGITPNRGSALGVWLKLDADRYWGLSIGGVSEIDCELSVQFSASPDGGSILSTGQAFIRATHET